MRGFTEPRGKGFAACIFVTLVSLASIMIYSPAAWGLDTTARTGAGFYWWDDNNKEKGEQFYIPVDVKAYTDQYSFRVLTGYLYSYYDGNGTDSHSMADLLDTKVNLTGTYSLPWDMRVLAGLDLNLPTGRTKLSVEDQQLLMDPDLVPITSFGEGFNVNPLLLVMRSWGETDIALGYSYVWRGEYDFATDITDYDPGDIHRFVARIQFRQFYPWSFQLGAVYTDYGTDELDDHDLYEPGSMWRLDAGFRYSGVKWSLKTEANYYIRDEDRFRIPGSFTLQDEDHNGYGDELAVRVRVRYRVTRATALRFGLGVLWIDENDYLSTSPYYKGERRRLSMSFGVDQALSRMWTLSSGVMGFTMHDGEAAVYQFEERSFRGYGLNVILTARF